MTENLKIARRVNRLSTLEAINDRNLKDGDILVYSDAGSSINLNAKKRKLIIKFLNSL